MPDDAFGDLAEVDEDGLWPQNEPALCAFLAVETQMRFIPVGDGAIYTGLDYAGARAGLRQAGLKVAPDLWSDVQMIEAAATAALNRKTR